MGSGIGNTLSIRNIINTAFPMSGPLDLLYLCYQGDQ